MFKTLLKIPGLLQPSQSRPHTTKMTPPNFLAESYTRLRATISARDTSTPLPSPQALQAGRSSLPPQLPTTGLGPEATHNHLLTEIVPALSNQSLSSTYFGFITGGVLLIAEAADNIVTALDQNVQVHLPESSLATEVEDAALRMLIGLLELGTSEDWPSRIVTTGATASNILGLACAREWVVDSRLAEDSAGSTVAKAGLLRACATAGVREIQILTSMAHSSLSKAASVVGLGHDSVKECAASEDEPWRVDLDKVERELKRNEEGVASIIVITAGEVNTGRFATNALDMPKLRSLADKYGAWIHVDGGT
jgi:glutamate/tyrosine decarboxylase-like PLP-dependent enzyme